MKGSLTNTFYHLPINSKVYIYHTYFNKIYEGVYKGETNNGTFLIHTKKHNIEIDNEYLYKDISMVRHKNQEEYIFGLSMEDLYENVMVDIENNKDEILETYIENVEKCFNKIK